MNNCYIDRMSKVRATSVRISANSEFNGIGASKIRYFCNEQVIHRLPDIYFK